MKDAIPHCQIYWNRGFNYCDRWLNADDMKEQLKGPKCTCGSDKVNGPGHSDWCDKERHKV